MTQQQRRETLIRYLLDEQPDAPAIRMPAGAAEQKSLLRGLMNVRRPAPVSPEFQRLQDEYLQEENRSRGTVDLSALVPLQEGVYLWQGNITRLACGAIVNAANSGMTGCYQPCHGCIDNCIHTFSGVQLRNYCAEMMEQQGYEEPVGRAKITPAFNLPCRCILHTVGPIVEGRLTRRHCDLLASCYRSCLELADEWHLESIAFCCISTGVFRFPNQQAAEIAVHTVRQYREQTHSKMKVIFNVYKNVDYRIYRNLLAAD